MGEQQELQAARNRLHQIRAEIEETEQKIKLNAQRFGKIDDLDAAALARINGKFDVNHPILDENEALQDDLNILYRAAVIQGERLEQLKGEFELNARKAVLNDKRGLIQKRADLVEQLMKACEAELKIEQALQSAGVYPYGAPLTSSSSPGGMLRYLKAWLDIYQTTGHEQP